jgi:hypothetical protein
MCINSSGVKSDLKMTSGMGSISSTSTPMRVGDTPHITTLLACDMLKSKCQDKMKNRTFSILPFLKPLRLSCKAWLQTIFPNSDSYRNGTGSLNISTLRELQKKQFPEHFSCMKNWSKGCFCVGEGFLRMICYATEYGVQQMLEGL